LESIKQVIFILGNREQGTGNREQGTGNREHTEGLGRIGKDWEGLGRIGEHTETIKSCPLPLQAIHYPDLS
jgi:hypothetical protein